MVRMHSMFVTAGALVAISCSIPLMSAAQTPGTLSNVLYGAAYYHEYMPYERLEKDVALMKEAGLSVVRMGESTWSLWEPEDGVFEYAWMDRVVDAMGKAGIKVIMGTPTYSIPTWMYHEHPEILARPLGARRCSMACGRTWTPTIPTFRFYAQRIIRKLVEHYRDNPAVIGWQIDNETGSYGASNHDVFVGFVESSEGKVRNGTGVEQGMAAELLGPGCERLGGFADPG